MNRDALIRELRKLARERGAEFRFVASRGKGSHGQVYFGDRTTIIKLGELRPGYVALVKRQLGID